MDDLNRPQRDFEQTGMINLNHEVLKDFHCGIDFIPENKKLIVEQNKQMIVRRKLDNQGVFLNYGKTFVDPY